MKQNNKGLLSLVVVFTMIMTMLSSMLVVNADASPEIYTKVTKTDTGVNLEIGYKGFDAETVIKTCEVDVQIPDGFEATVGADNKPVIELSDWAKQFNPSKNVTATKKVKISGANPDGIKTGDSGIIATVPLTVTANPTITTPYPFNVLAFSGKIDDTNKLTLTNGVTANNGEYVIEVAVTGPQVYVKTSPIKDGKVTITVAFKEFTDTLLKTCEVDVQLPDGFTAVMGSDNKPIIELSDWAKQFNPSKNVTVANKLKISGANADGVHSGAENDIATVELIVPDGFEGDAYVTPVAFSGKIDSTNKLTFANGVSAVAGKITTTGSEPTPPTTEGEVTAVKLDKTEFTAKAGATVTITATVEGTTENKDVTATATNGATVTVDGNVVKVTVPDTAETGDEITVTVAADADATKTATAKITVNNPAYEIKGADETFKVNGKTNKMFKPAITVDDAEKFAAAFNDTESYRIVFDFRTAKNANAGYGLFVVTGAQLKAIAGGADAGIYSTVSGAASAELHIETTSGDIK